MKLAARPHLSAVPMPSSPRPQKCHACSPRSDKVPFRPRMPLQSAATGLTKRTQALGGRSIEHTTSCRMNSVNFVNSEGSRSAFHLGKLVESAVGSGSTQEKAALALNRREEFRLHDLFKNRDLDLAPGAAEDPSDVIRAYLREAGRISLLTRRAEVEVAKRIERGQLNTLKALSR